MSNSVDHDQTARMRMLILSYTGSQFNKPDFVVSCHISNLLCFACFYHDSDDVTCVETVTFTDMLFI